MQCQALCTSCPKHLHTVKFGEERHFGSEFDAPVLGLPVRASWLRVGELGEGTEETTIDVGLPEFGAFSCGSWEIT
jgi:hypothetical protein